MASEKINPDERWNEVMQLAKQYGFIIQAAAGTAILATHKNQIEHYGEEKYRDIQRMNGLCVKKSGCTRKCEDCYLTKKERGHGYGVDYL